MSEQETYNDFESLCAGYVLDALTDEERREFEQILANASGEQKELYEKMVRARDEMALATEPVEPSDDLFVRILNDISDTPAQKASIIPMWAYQAVAAVLLIGFLGLALFNQELSTTVEQQETIISELTGEIEKQEELLSILESREVNLILMAGQEVSPDGYGKIIWDAENRQALLQLANLPEPPSDKDYQLWLIKDEEESPISAGVFNFDRSSTDLFFKVEHLNQTPSATMNTFAVTLEPKGGVPQPTGDMYLVGQGN